MGMEQHVGRPTQSGDRPGKQGVNRSAKGVSDTEAARYGLASLDFTHIYGMKRNKKSF